MRGAVRASVILADHSDGGAVPSVLHMFDVIFHWPFTDFQTFRCLRRSVTGSDAHSITGVRPSGSSIPFAGRWASTGTGPARVGASIARLADL